MDVLARYFDHYVISARIKPAFFVVLPLAVTVLVWWPQSQELGGAIVAFLVTFGAIGFFSNLISNSGNALQLELFTDWGGAPTTALLRHGDQNLDHYTKQRYHQRLEEMTPGLRLPTLQDENANPSNADDAYTSAVAFLRELSRDKVKYPMVYADNVAYGYARNLLVMRRWGLLCATCGTALNLFLLYPEISALLRGVHGGGLQQPESYGLISMAASLVMLLVFAAFVNKSYVKGRAIRYARSLLAVCDSENLSFKGAN